MSQLDQDQLRRLVREALKDALGGATGVSEVAQVVSAGVPDLGPTVSEMVVLDTDADLARFVSRVLDLAADEQTLHGLRSGRINFSLARANAVPTTATVGNSAIRVPRGAVTERIIKQAADQGAELVLAPGAVLTPLARDKARSLGVRVTREKGTP